MAYTNFDVGLPITLYGPKTPFVWLQPDRAKQADSFTAVRQDQPVRLCIRQDGEVRANNLGDDSAIGFTHLVQYDKRVQPWP